MREIRDIVYLQKVGYNLAIFVVTFPIRPNISPSNTFHTFLKLSEHLLSEHFVYSNILISWVFYEYLDFFHYLLVRWIFIVSDPILKWLEREARKSADLY